MRYRYGYLWQATSSELATRCAELADDSHRVADPDLRRELRALSASWNTIAGIDVQDATAREWHAVYAAALRRRMIEIIIRVGASEEHAAEALTAAHG